MGQCQQGLQGRCGPLGPLGRLHACGCISTEDETVESCAGGPLGNPVGALRWGAQPVLSDDHVVEECDDAMWSHLTLSRCRLFEVHSVYKIHQCYRLEQQIGEGSYGLVHQAVAIDSHAKSMAPRRVAVKTFSLQPARPGSSRGSESCRASFETERFILSGLEHPHIVRMYECFKEPDALFIAVELCRGGALYDYIVKKQMEGAPAGLEETNSRGFFRQMLHGVCYLHTRRIVHRDIKSENFLLLGDSDSPDSLVLKLCDFGTAALLSDEHPRSMDRVGTLSYTAPEVFAGLGANVMADAWSLGAVLYVLLVGASPFRTSAGESRAQTIKRIQDANFERRRAAWQRLPEEVQGLVSDLLVVNEAVRLSSSQALIHSWMEPNSLSAMTPIGVISDTVSSFAPAVLASLHHFSQLDGIQRLALAMCAMLVSESDVMAMVPVPWYDLFFFLDRNNDGRIDVDEFIVGIRGLMPDCALHDSQLKALCQSVDTDGSGSIEWTEWVASALTSSVKEMTSDVEPLRTAFRILDGLTGDDRVDVPDVLALVAAHDSPGPDGSYAEGERVLQGLMHWGQWGDDPDQSASLKLADLRRALEAGQIAPRNETDPYP